MRHTYGTKASIERLEKKWNDSGMTDCRSMPEFLLRFEVMHFQIDGDDLVFLAESALSDTDFCRVMIDLVKSTTLFDKALTELEFYIDYYMAMSADVKPDPLKYGRVRLLNMYETGGSIRYSFTRGSGNAAEYRDFISVCADKADRLFGGKLEHVKNFKDWLAARTSGK